MNLNQNPKVLHFSLEAVQILGILGTVLSFPGLGAIAPWAGIASGVITGIATVIKTQVIGNIPGSPPPSS